MNPATCQVCETRHVQMHVFVAGDYVRACETCIQVADALRGIGQVDLDKNPGPGVTYCPRCLAMHCPGTAKPRIACDKASEYAIEYQCSVKGGCGAWSSSMDWMNWNQARAAVKGKVA
jgi:hypothetical protein